MSHAHRFDSLLILVVLASAVQAPLKLFPAFYLSPHVSHDELLLVLVFLQRQLLLFFCPFHGQYVLLDHPSLDFHSQNRYQNVLKTHRIPSKDALGSHQRLRCYFQSHLILFDPCASLVVLLWPAFSPVNFPKPLVYFYAAF
jgi:hypothetical protein